MGMQQQMMDHMLWQQVMWMMGLPYLRFVDRVHIISSVCQSWSELQGLPLITPRWGCGMRRDLYSALPFKFNP